MRKFLFLVGTLFIFTSAYGYEYREVSAINKTSVRLEPNDSSKKIGELTKDQSAVVVQESDRWLQIVLSSKDLIGWVFEGDVVTFSNPELYEFKVDRTVAIGLAKVSLNRVDQSCAQKKPFDTSNPFVSAVSGKACDKETARMILVSFKQLIPGKKITIYLKPVGQKLEFVQGFCSQGLTDKYEIDDLREWVCTR